MPLNPKPGLGCSKYTPGGRSPVDAAVRGRGQSMVCAGIASTKLESVAARPPRP
jgi:hypothetical protein